MRATVPGIPAMESNIGAKHGESYKEAEKRADIAV